MNGFAELYEAVEVGGLGEEGVGAELVGQVDVARVVTAGENDDAKSLEIGLGAEPCKESLAAHSGQLEIEEDEGGQGVLSSLVVLVHALEVSDRFLCADDNSDGVWNLCLGKGAAQERCVGGVIFDEQNGGLIFHSP